MGRREKVGERERGEGGIGRERGRGGRRDGEREGGREGGSERGRERDLGGDLVVGPDPLHGVDLVPHDQPASRRRLREGGRRRGRGR